MYWIKEMQNAIGFIESRLTEKLGIEEISRSANSSCANFQRIFSLVTGMTAGEYIRSRRLSLAGKVLAESDAKVLDIALAYGYETSESFTKAFTRFHGATPAAVRRGEASAKIFAPFTIDINIRGGFVMTRKLIPNVPEIPYDGNNAGFFTTLLDAVLKSLGEDCDKAMLTALSGEGNRFCWTDGAWVFGNELLESVNETPFEMESRVLSALGWNAKYITVQRDANGDPMNTDDLQIRRDFVSAIDRGYPVLIRYVEHADCDRNVFFGYEDDGEKIVGYDYNSGFEPGAEPDDAAQTPTAWENWERNISSYILLEGRTNAVSERETALSAFRFAAEHARKSYEIGGRKVGLAAWESFLYHLENDDFSELPFDEVKSRFFIYCDALCQIFARKDALPYYSRLAERFPEWSDALNKAVEALDDCASYGGYLWSRGFTFDDAGFEKFRSKEARKPLADAGRAAMENDRRAVEEFESLIG